MRCGECASSNDSVIVSVAVNSSGSNSYSSSSHCSFGQHSAIVIVSVMSGLTIVVIVVIVIVVMVVMQLLSQMIATVRIVMLQLQQEQLWLCGIISFSQ
jgi:hypothetical protein